jgi:hypothetical protein
MTRPENPYEAASYDLKQFRERRMEDRRMTPRATMDRRQVPPNGGGQSPQPEIIDPQRDH